MSTALAKYEETKAELERLQKEVEKLEGSEALKRELKFKEKLEKLMTEYDYSGKQTLTMLAGIDSSVKITEDGAVKATGKRKPRPLMVYKNPHTGETIKTKGGNHKVLKEWREQYGADKVASWRQD